MGVCSDEVIGSLVDKVLDSNVRDTLLRVPPPIKEFILDFSLLTGEDLNIYSYFYLSC